MGTPSKHLRVLCVGITLAFAFSAYASVVVTQIESRAFFSLWLLSDHPQQNIAHQQIINNHDVTAIPEFTAEALIGVDIVYVSPALDELQLTTAEIDVLEAFVTAGGRLIIPADNSVWADEFRELAARFEVTYGTSYINGVWPADVGDFVNPITNGPAGVVNVFSGASHNDELSSTNQDFRALATWRSGPAALGYLPHGAGEVVFLTDFNTWDNDMIADFDNQILWTNLFESPACTGDLDGDGDTDQADLGILLADWGCTGGDCPGDLNADGNTDQADLGILLADWGCTP